MARDVVPAIFAGSGPPGSDKPPSAHFRDSDWMINP